LVTLFQVAGVFRSGDFLFARRAAEYLIFKEFYMINRKIIFAAAGVVLGIVLLVMGCELGVNDPVRSIPIINPYISVQPKSFSYNISDYSNPPELSIEVTEWRKEDGEISYQWYTFTDLAAYSVNKRGTPINGATRPSYTPGGISPEEGKMYYYYVVVTNYFQDATDRTRATVQSELSIISFYNGATQAPFPVVTRHPTNASYQMGRTASVSQLEVRAEVSSGSLSYQWYSNTIFSAEGGAPISGAINSSFMPDINTLSMGENYFYVVITNTLRASGADRVSTVTCLPVIINMRPGDKAEKPRIILQPKDQFVFGGTVSALSVGAIPVDGGTLTYQWYSTETAGDTATGTGDNRVITPVVGVRIDDATESTYTPPPVGTGRNYYYVVVTNNNPNVVGDKTAPIRSKIVAVSAATVGTSIEANVTVTIRDPSVADNRFQYIRGYGGMDVAWANFPGQLKADTELMHNPDWGLGYNIMRIMILPPGSTDGNFVSHDETVQKLLGTTGKYDYLNNVKIVNDYGGYVLASPWTPPKEWKTNNSVNSGGHLIPAYYKLFANYLKSYCQYMYYQGVPVYAVSIANEPNYAGGYDGCEWTPEQMRDFFKEVGHFTDGVRGYGGGKSTPVVLTVNGESANTPSINFLALLDPVSRQAIDFYARHVYGSQTTQLWTNVYASWKEGDPYQTECWMTEHNINSATPAGYELDSTYNYIWRFMDDIDLVIRLNHENAFVWWASKRFYSFVGDGQYGAAEGAALPRGYGMSHFAKYTIDTTRLNVSVTGTAADGTYIPHSGRETSVVNQEAFGLDNLTPKITAYVSQDGNEISLVMYTPTLTDGSGGMNMGMLKIDMPAGFDIGSVRAHRSTSTNGMMQPEYNVTVAAEQNAAWVTLGRGQILSVKFTRN
jgi:O-glycosyl hydrolase